VAEAGAGLAFSVVAAEAVGQFYCVKVTPAGAVVTTSLAGEDVVGVAQDRAQPGEAVAVQFVGVSKVRSAGLFDVGSILSADSSGRAVALVGSSLAYPLNVSIGTALTASTGLDTVVYALLCPRPQPYYLEQLGATKSWWQQAS
jgi:Uncharacterized conserved protein (DUF2190)